MKKSFKRLLTALSVGAYGLYAASPELPPVSLGFFNAVGLPTKTDFQIDGNSLKPAGFPSGNFVENFGLPPGLHAAVFSNGDCKPLARKIQVNPAARALYVLYNLAVTSPDGTVQQTLNLVGIAAPSRSTGRHFYAYLVSPNEAVELRANGATVTLLPFKLTPIDGSSLTIDAGTAAPEHYTPIDQGHYVLVVFENPDKRMSRALVQLNE